MLMHFIRQHPVFGSLIGTALLATIVLCAAITVLAIVNHRAKTRLKQRQHELRTFAAAGLLLSEVEAKLAAEKISALEQQNAASFTRDYAAPKQIARSDATAPVNSTDAFFEIAAFVERMAARGRSFGVGMASNERFGFAVYAKSGPEQELISAVLKQQEIIERLLDYLFAAHPERLLSVSRENPAKGGRAQTGPVGTQSAELFTFSLRQPLRVESGISTTAVQIAFVGDTAVLRKFLNAITEQGSRLLVRSVKAEAMSDGPSDRANGHPPRSPTTTIGPRTKFTVIIEAFEFLQPIVPEAISS